MKNKLNNISIFQPEGNKRNVRTLNFLHKKHERTHMQNNLTPEHNGLVSYETDDHPTNKILKSINGHVRSIFQSYMLISQQGTKTKHIHMKSGRKII